MRKSTLFLSATLTTFMLVVMFGVVSAYQKIASSNEMAVVQPQPTDAAQMVSEPLATAVPTQAAAVVNISPQTAAALAGKVIGRTDLYSVEVAQFEGKDVYLVTFSSRDLVYVSLDGQILSISKLPVTVINQPAPKKNKKNNGNQNNTTVTNAGGGESEGGG